MSGKNLRYSTMMFAGLVVFFLIWVVGWYVMHPVTRGSLPVHALQTRIDVNTATAAELELLPDIGPVLARHIVATRRAKGAFRTIEDLGRVPGIGPVTEQELGALIRFGDGGGGKNTKVKAKAR